MIPRDKETGETKEIEASTRRWGREGEEEEEMEEGDTAIGNEREAATVDRNTHRKEPAMMQSKIRRQDTIQTGNSSPGDSVARDRLHGSWLALVACRRRLMTSLANHAATLTPTTPK